MNILFSKELVRTAILKLRLSKKKARFYGEPSNLKEKTAIFLERIDYYIKQNRRFLSIDETSFGRNGINAFGYSKKGSPLYIKKKQPRVTTISSVCCAYSDGAFVKKNINGSFNTEKFVNFLNNLDTENKDVILMDNVSFHHSKLVIELLKQKNVDILFVPPYSPWFNPIELCFSIVKREYYKSQDVEAVRRMWAASILSPRTALCRARLSLTSALTPGWDSSKDRTPLLPTAAAFINGMLLS